MKPSLGGYKVTKTCSRYFRLTWKAFRVEEVYFLAVGFLPDRRGEAESDPITIFRIGLN